MPVLIYLKNVCYTVLVNEDYKSYNNNYVNK